MNSPDESIPLPTVLSRRLLVEVLLNLSPFQHALTVVGSHAVMIHAERAGFMELDSTADADTVLDPRFVAESPSIMELMRENGLELANEFRPGIFGYRGEGDVRQRERTTIDLIVPELYAGSGRRSARVPGHKNAMTRATGLELALFDREPALVSTFPGESPALQASIHVAGVGALLTAKGHKVSDRLEEVDRRPYRLREKDSKDIGWLMLSSNPVEVAENVDLALFSNPALQPIVLQGLEFVASRYHSSFGVSLVRDHLYREFRESPDISDVIDNWIETFRASSKLFSGGLSNSAHA